MKTTAILAFVLIFNVLSVNVKAQHSNQESQVNPSNPILSLQSGYLQISRTIHYPNVDTFSNKSLVHVYFRKNDAGTFDIIYEDNSTVYLLKSGHEEMHKRVRSGFIQLEQFTSPLHKEGLVSSYFHPSSTSKSVIENALSEYLPFYKNKADSSNIFIDSHNQNLQDEEGYPISFSKDTKIDTKRYSIQETLKLKILNAYEKEDFEDLYLAKLAKVNQPHYFDQLDHIFIPEQLFLFNLAGNQYQAPENELSLFIYIPKSDVLTPDLMDFVIQIPLKYKGIRVNFVTAQEEVLNALATKSMENTYLGSIEILKSYHLYDSQIRFSLLGNKGLIQDQWIGFYPEQQLRIHKAITANLEK
jgi:hypothetical protein